MRGVMVIKDIERHGYFYDKIATVVLERTRENNIVHPPRETENSTGPWFYTGNETGYRSSKSLLHEMIDVVSKNCNFVLNIPPRPDGTFDDSSLQILKDFGAWFQNNGEAIYGTRPWHVFGDGDVRFTTKDNNLYLIYLEKPSKTAIVGALASLKKEEIKSVTLMGSPNKINWSITETGLHLNGLQLENDELAYVIKIECVKKPIELSYAKADLQSVEETNEQNKEKYGADGHGKETLD